MPLVSQNQDDSEFEVLALLYAHFATCRLVLYARIDAHIDDVHVLSEKLLRNRHCYNLDGYTTYFAKI